MANVVVMAGYYYPYFSPNGNIMKNILDELKKEHVVKVIAVKNHFGLSKTEEYDGYEIVRINEFSTCFHNYFEKKKQNANFLERNSYNFLLQVKRISLLLRKISRSTSLDDSIIKKHLNALEKINGYFPIDVVLPVSLPYESFIAAKEFKNANSNVKVIPFQLDHFTDSQTLHNFDFIKRFRYRKHIEIEKDCINKSDHYFILPQLKEHFNDKTFEELKNKITVCEHPLLKDIEIKKNTDMGFSDRHINLVYAGALYKEIRNPKYMLDMLKCIPSEENICFNVYHFGDCDDIINEYKKELEEGLQNNGKVTTEESFAAINNSEVLISIGNSISNQVPSKIFEYFSFGKAIVHLYNNDDDPYLELLSNYPLSLCIKMDENNLKENSKRLLEFCKTNAGKTVDFEKVEEIYYDATPKFVGAKYSEIINRK
ncbi:hypothetical protein MKY29_12800 [Psychrobacillus sp. FSL K6-2365]|uniref:hypothetical protein n=1 Tax=Psychrobacillus sp. FSL K6-2365 TaxID=2921546 RepID=UPI0030F8B10F